MIHFCILGCLSSIRPISHSLSARVGDSRKRRGWRGEEGKRIEILRSENCWRAPLLPYSTTTSRFRRIYRTTLRLSRKRLSTDSDIILAEGVRRWTGRANLIRTISLSTTRIGRAKGRSSSYLTTLSLRLGQLKRRIDMSRLVQSLDHLSVGHVLRGFGQLLKAFCRLGALTHWLWQWRLSLSTTLISDVVGHHILEVFRALVRVWTILKPSEPVVRHIFLRHLPYGTMRGLIADGCVP